MGCSTLPCPWLSPGVCSNLCPLSWWCHPTISSSAAPFSCCFQSFPASGFFPVNQLCSSHCQCIGASASVLPMSIQGWFPLGLTDLYSLQSKEFSRVFSSTTILNHLKKKGFVPLFSMRSWAKNSCLTFTHTQLPDNTSQLPCRSVSSVTTSQWNMSRLCIFIRHDYLVFLLPRFEDQRAGFMFQMMNVQEDGAIIILDLWGPHGRQLPWRVSQAPFTLCG